MAGVEVFATALAMHVCHAARARLGNFLAALRGLNFVAHH
jgi:hypothetical protein